MKRTYLEEDLELIRKYFPGAKTVALRTPFDLTARGRRASRLGTEDLQDSDAPRNSWGEGILWTS
jgi:hypothetical protein